MRQRNYLALALIAFVFLGACSETTSAPTIPATQPTVTDATRRLVFSPATRPVALVPGHAAVAPAGRARVRAADPRALASSGRCVHLNGKQ